jgi:hypothetical protein
MYVCTHTDLKKFHPGGILTRELLLKTVSIPSSCVIKIGMATSQKFLAGSQTRDPLAERLIIGRKSHLII